MLLKFHHCTKFDAEKNNRLRIHAPKTKFNMAAAAILNLFPVAIFNIMPTIERNYHTKIYENIKIHD